MKTININLIDDLAKETKESKIQVLSSSDDINPKVKLASIIIFVSICIVFVISFGIWSISSIMLKKTGKELEDLKLEHEKVSAEVTKLTNEHKNIEKQNKILEIKLVAQNTVETSILPWHKILLNISRAVPKNVQINEISEAGGIRNADENSTITIKGQIPSRKSKIDSFKSMSFFILNINNNSFPDSTLGKAVLKKFDLDIGTNAYTFEIASTLKIGKKNIENEK